MVAVSFIIVIAIDIGAAIMITLSVFLSATWLPHDHLWLTVERAASLTQCQSLYFLLCYSTGSLITRLHILARLNAVWFQKVK